MRTWIRVISKLLTSGQTSNITVKDLNSKRRVFLSNNSAMLLLCRDALEGIEMEY